MRINKSVKIVVSKAWRLQTNPGSGKTYKHTFVRKGRDVQRMFTFAPNKSIWDSYETKKDKFMDELYEKIEIEATDREKKLIKKKPLGPFSIDDLTPREKDVYPLIFTKGLTQEECGKILGISQSRVSELVINIEEKSQIPRKIEEKRVVKPLIPPLN